MKKRGRPKGSKSAPAEVAEKDLPRCRSCKSTNMLRTGPLNEMESHGYRNGDKSQPFTSVAWPRYKCQDCDSVSIVKAHYYDPTKWR